MIPGSAAVLGARSLLGVDGAAIHHGGDLAVRAAGVKPMRQPPDAHLWGGPPVGLREALLRRLHAEGTAVHRLHHGHVKGTGAVGAEDLPSWEIRTSSPCSVTRHPPTLHSSSLMVRSRYRRSQAPATDACLIHTVPFPSTAMRKAGGPGTDRPSATGQRQKVRLQAGSILYGKRDARYSIAGSSLWALYWHSSAGCSSGRRAVSTAPRYTTSRS